MSDLDLDRLGDVWRQQPDPAELERLRRTALKVARRARWGRFVDLIATVTVASVVLLLILRNPQQNTVLAGTATILLLLLSHRRQERLRRIELKSLSGGTEEMIAQSIDRIEATTRHHRFTLMGIVPALALVVLFSSTISAQVGMILAPFRETSWFRPVWVGAWLAIGAAAIAFAVLSLRRGRRELARLRAMQDSYEEERTSAKL